MLALALRSRKFLQNTFCFLGTSRTMGEHHRNPSVVVAVDIGTTHSGYSIQSTSDSAKDPLNKKQSLFLSEKDHKMHGKTASCLLLNPDKSFNSFG